MLTRGVATRCQPRTAPTAPWWLTSSGSVQLLARGPEHRRVLPLIPGLPADFAQATLSGLMADATQTPIPAGVVRVDRAGHDLMGSSDAAFGLAAQVLRGALAARLSGGDLETGARAAYRDPS
jgi:hypothetical protein